MIRKFQKPNLGFMHMTPMQMLTHLYDGSGDHDFTHITELMKQHTTSWENAENLATKFTRDDKVKDN